MSVHPINWSNRICNIFINGECDQPTDFPTVRLLRFFNADIRFSGLNWNFYYLYHRYSLLSACISIYSKWIYLLIEWTKFISTHTNDPLLLHGIKHLMVTLSVQTFQIHDINEWHTINKKISTKMNLTLWLIEQYDCFVEFG